MGFLSRLFTRAAPTDTWPLPQGSAPQVSLDRQALETFGARVHFADPLDSARCLGRPDHFTSHSAGCSLIYLAWGLELRFEDVQLEGRPAERRLMEVFYRIGEHYRESLPEVTLATPRGPDGGELSGRTVIADVLGRFGEPRRRQDIEGETILYYAAGPLVSEFEFDEEDRLTAWTVYLD
jgi:hypothetical protein